MSIFSRFRKAKKAAEEHKKAVAAQAEVEPPQSPYRHIPTHAAQDALAATPTTFTHEETREKIAVVRKRKSEMLMREKKYPQRPSIDASARGNISVPLHRVRSDGYMNEIPFRETLQSQAYVEPTGCGRQPRRSHDDYSSYPKEEPHEYFHAFSYPRDVPPPPVTMRPRKYPTASRKSSIANMKKSLLSTMTMEEEPEEYFSSSSRDSGYTTASNQTPRSSSSYRRISSISRNSIASKLPSLPMPKFVSEKSRPALTATEISSPYQSDEDDNVKKARNTLPTWRYEDFLTETEPPVMVTSHSRESSSGSMRL